MGTSILFNPAERKTTTKIPETKADSNLILGLTFLVMSSAKPAKKTGKDTAKRVKNSFPKGFPRTVENKPETTQAEKTANPPILGVGF